MRKSNAASASTTTAWPERARIEEQQKREAPLVEAAKRAQEARENRPAGDIIADRFRRAEQERAEGKRPRNAIKSSMSEGLGDLSPLRLSPQDADDLRHGEGKVGDPVDMRDKRADAGPLSGAQLAQQQAMARALEENTKAIGRSVEAPEIMAASGMQPAKSTAFDVTQGAPGQNSLQVADATPAPDPFPKPPGNDATFTAPRPGQIGGTPLPQQERQRASEHPGPGSMKVQLNSELQIAPLRVEHVSGQTGEIQSAEFLPVTQVDAPRALGTKV